MSEGGGASGGRRPWWSSEDPARGGAEEAAGDGHAHAHPTVEACQVCPICALLRMVGEARPDLVEHLSEAARHLTLAAKAIVDAHAEGFGKDTGFQRVPLDEE